jgi:hypothetical protein
MAKDKNDKCQLNLKGIDCDLVTWYRQEANEKNRSLNQHIIYVMKRYKQVANREIVIDNYPFND